MAGRYLDQVLFIALPYVSLFTFFLMTVYRYRAQSFSYSSLSSQFLENKQHFWAVVPFHYGILVVTLGHLIAFLVPRSILAWNSHPLRLYILEISALAADAGGARGNCLAAVCHFEGPHHHHGDRLVHLRHVAVAGGQRRRHRFVPHLGLVVVRDELVSLPVVDHEA
jgi:Nitrate reductase gamma subunit